MDYYVNTIVDMPNEKDFFYLCKKFEYIHEFEKFLWKIDDDTLVYEVLYEKDYYKLLLFGANNFTIWKIVTIFDNAAVFN